MAENLLRTLDSHTGASHIDWIEKVNVQVNELSTIMEI